MTVRETDRFRAEGPDGGKFLVVEYTTFTVIQYVNGKSQELRGAPDYKLVDGQEVSRTDTDGEFVIFPDGPRIRRLNGPPVKH